MEKITVAWANEQRNIILVTYHTNDWQWSDVTMALAEQRTLIDQTDAPGVHVIVDVSKAQFVPKGGSLVSLSRNITKYAHPRQGHTVIVGARGALATILDISKSLLGSYGFRFHPATTLNAAHEILSQLEP
jgi:hypothetical protein